MADWNIEPGPFVQSGWPERLGTRVVTPTCLTTCDKGPGRMYDYGLVGRGFPEVTLSPDLSV
eukprot:7976726-Pyramimonas_sp.AAC.1